MVKMIFIFETQDVGIGWFLGKYLSLHFFHLLFGDLELSA
ncbi:hypothetical protein PC116_g34239 [Phytophthora cactorum]|nr:hypothetical protein PC116_g34239 [Phytophthora cactorum]